MHMAAEASCDSKPSLDSRGAIRESDGEVTLEVTEGDVRRCGRNGLRPLVVIRHDHWDATSRSRCDDKRIRRLEARLSAQPGSLASDVIVDGLDLEIRE